MPAGDNTGPEGMGPRTGRGAGYCAGNDAPGFAEPGFGYGRGRGRGRGFANAPRQGFGFRGRPRRGMGYRAAPPVYPGAYEYTEEQEAADLKAQAGWLQQQLDAITKRIAELNPKAE